MEKETRISLTRLIREIARSDGVSAPIRRVRITRDILSFLSLNFKLVAIKVSKGCFTTCEYFSREFDSEFIVDTFFFFLRFARRKRKKSSLEFGRKFIKNFGTGILRTRETTFFPPFLFPSYISRFISVTFE